MKHSEAVMLPAFSLLGRHVLRHPGAV